MLPFKKIICPTDFSEPSYEAIKAGGEIADHFGSELCILHVVSPVPVVPVGAEPSAFNVSLYEQELETTSKKSLEEIINRLEWKDLKVRLIVLRGNAADEIVRTAHEENADLIVIATRGRTGLDRLIFGSVAEKVVRLAQCPVLTVTGRPSADTEEERKKLLEMKESGEEAWEGLKSGIEKGLDDLKETLDQSISKFKEIGEDVADSVLKKKKAYVEKVEVQLQEWGPQIDILKAKAQKSKVEAKVTYLKQIEEMKRKLESAKQKLHEIKDSGGEAFEEVRVGLDKALDEVKQAFTRAKSKFKDK